MADINQPRLKSALGVRSGEMPPHRQPQSVCIERIGRQITVLQIPLPTVPKRSIIDHAKVNMPIPKMLSAVVAPNS
jgi:hypothetical protein